MRKIILTAIIAICALQTNAFVQPKPQNNNQKCTHETVQQMRIAFVASKLELTTKQSQMFWPLNNQYTKELLELGRQRREIRKSLNGKTDKNALRKWLELEQKEVDIKKDYAEKLEDIIPNDKIVKAFVVEERFKYHLLKNFHKK